MGSLLWSCSLCDGETPAFVGCRSPAAVGPDPNLVHLWHVRSTESGWAMAAFEELARQIGPIHVLTLDPSEVGTPWRLSFDGSLIGGSR